MRKFMLVVSLLFIAERGFSQSAREYYDELYKAGGLDRMADEYVCFDDDPKLQTFFIFGKSDTLRAFLQEKGQYQKLPAGEKAELTRGFLTARGYDRGVPLSDEDTYKKDGDSWSTDVFYIEKTPMRIRLSISWQTLRYKRAVEILRPNLTVKEVVPRYGRCDLVAGDVRQTAN